MHETARAVRWYLCSMIGSYSPQRYVYLRFHLDANRINARQGLACINQLERWAEDEIIELFMSEVAQNEARRGTNARRTRKALGYIFSMSMPTTPGEQNKLRELETLLACGNPLDPNTERDAEICFNAGKYMAILITADHVILSNRAALAKIGIRVMTDDEAAAFVRSKIAERDRIAQEWARATGQPPPDWVGRD